jgi:hypothetical protein
MSCIFAVALAFVGCVAVQAKVNGDYVESRSADTLCLINAFSDRH